jgi:hypothetical protein
MQSAPERRSKTGTCTPTRAESVHACSRDVRQLAHLSEVYWQSPEYYRAALRPTIAGIMQRIKEART